MGRDFRVQVGRRGTSGLIAVVQAALGCFEGRYGALVISAGRSLQGLDALEVRKRSVRLAQLSTLPSDRSHRSGLQPLGRLARHGGCSQQRARLAR